MSDKKSSTGLRILGLIGTVVALTMIGRLLLFVPVLFKFVFIPLVLSVPVGLVYYLSQFYSNSPTPYDTDKTGTTSRTFTQAATAEDGPCYCGETSDRIEVETTEVALNGRALVELSRSEEPYCDEHLVRPEDVDDIRRQSMEVEEV